MSPKRKSLLGMVVRSDEYVVHRAEGEVEEFIGNVYYRHHNRQMQSDWAQWDHRTELWQARGHVHGQYAMQSGDRLEAWGDRAEHRMAARQGRLSGENPQTMIRYQHEIATGTPPTMLPMEHGTARAMEWDEARNSIKLTGDVHGIGPEGEVWSEEALYRDEDRTLHLTGRRPVVAYQEPQWNGAIQGDTMKAEKERSRMDADGRVRGWIVFAEAGTRNSKKKSGAKTKSETTR